MGRSVANFTRRSVLGGMASIGAGAASSAPRIASADEPPQAVLYAYSEWLQLERHMLAVQMFPGDPSKWNLPFPPAGAGHAHEAFFAHWLDGKPLPLVGSPVSRSAEVLALAGVDVHGLADFQRRTGFEWRLKAGTSSDSEARDDE